MLVSSVNMIMKCCSFEKRGLCDIETPPLFILSNVDIITVSIEHSESQDRLNAGPPNATLVQHANIIQFD